MTAPPAPPPPAAPPGAAPPAVYVYPPPPPGYAYGYYYPPPPPILLPRYPSDAAAASSPFIDLIALGVAWDKRFSGALNVGAQAGLFVGGRLRLAARIAFPTETTNDRWSSDVYGYGRDSKATSFIYGASAGVVVVSSQTFALSPGVAFARSDVGDYGSALAFALPFDWVLSSGMRVGLQVDFGRAFGGNHWDQTCSPAPCSVNRDRDSGTAFMIQFNLGYGFNHPGRCRRQPRRRHPRAD